MRKRLKNKKTACALCKPHKRAWENRWKPEEFSRLKQDEADMRSARRRG